MPTGTSSRMTNFPLWRSASRSTRLSRTIPSQCSQVKSYIQLSQFNFVNGDNQELIMLDKTHNDADGRRLVSGSANNHIACAASIHRQDLVDLARENGGLDIQHIEVILIHFIIGMFRQSVSMIKDGGANAFKFATGHG